MPCQQAIGLPAHGLVEILTTRSVGHRFSTSRKHSGPPDHAASSLVAHRRGRASSRSSPEAPGRRSPAAGPLGPAETRARLRTVHRATPTANSAVPGSPAKGAKSRTPLCPGPWIRWPSPRPVDRNPVSFDHEDARPWSSRSSTTRMIPVEEVSSHLQHRVHETPVRALEWPAPSL